MNRYFKIENTPLALSGIALGLTSLSILWDAHGIKYVKAAAVCVSLVVLCLVFIKILLNPKKLLKIFQNHLPITRLVCTYLNVFFSMLIPNMVMKI